MGSILFILSIVLAVLGLVFGLLGIIFNKHTLRKQKNKETSSGYFIEYQIPEFYKKIFEGDKPTIYLAFIVFGFLVFAVFTFFSIGIGLVNAGNDNGWVFIAITSFIVIFLVYSHINKYQKSK